MDEYPRAAAQVARQSLANLLASGAGVVTQQVRCRDDHAGRAEPALHGPVFGKGLLQGVRLLGRAQAFDGGQGLAVELRGKGQAGQARPAVHEHGAGSAFTGAAAFLDAGQAEGFAKQVDGPLVASDVKLRVPAVDVKADDHACPPECRR
jgi:hypothetical protein